MSLSDNYPDIRPLWMNDYANAGVIDPRCSFARSDSTPSNVHYWSDEDHLSSENLIAYSNPATSQWTETNTAITVNSTAAPDGTTTASNVLETAATGYHEVRETFACTNAVSHTATFYAKANGRTVVRFLPRTSSGVIAIVEFTLSGAGSESLISGTATRSIAAVGSGGWYKLTVTFTGNATATGEFQVNVCESAGTDSYAGDVTKGIYLWGAQVASTGETVLNETNGQIHREYAATLKPVSYSGQPRFEYEPTGDRGAKGLLVESSVANVIPYSKNGYNASNAFQFTPTYGITTTENAGVGPSGNLDAALITEDTSTGSHQWQVTPTVVAGKNTISVYVKPIGGADYFGIRVADVNTYGAIYTFSTLSYTNYGVTPEETRIETLSNGWYRVSITQTLNAGARLIRFNLVGAGGNPSYAGNGYNGCLTYGYQCEANAFPSSWVDTGTSGSTSTRTADSLSVATADVGYAGGDFSLVFETPAGTGQGSYPMLFRLGTSGNNANRLQLYKDDASANSSDNWYAYLNSSGLGTATGTAGSSKVAVSFASSDFAIDSDTGSLFTNTSVIPPLVDHLAIGCNDLGTSNLNGHIKRVALYSEALTDTELQSLTS